MDSSNNCFCDCPFCTFLCEHLLSALIIWLR
ncbi:SWIM zinc finger family protein [Phyllobacterium sp. LjRoot231]